MRLLSRAQVGSFKGLTSKQPSWLENKIGRPTFDRLHEDSGKTQQPSEPVVDRVDASDIKNPQAVIPYLMDIHRHYREAEVRTHHRLAPHEPPLPSAAPVRMRRRSPHTRDTSKPSASMSACRVSRRACAPLSQSVNIASATYMSKQTDVNEKMRAILIDWLVEVHLKFKLMVETLYLTVNLIDRFLEKETITRNKLQLVGVTAMFLASKYEEIYAPECRDFVYISDKAYTREQILAMEGTMLAKLNFQLTTPNAYVFLKRFAKVAGIATTPRSKTDFLASYLVELTLQEYKMLKYLPSTIAAAAVYLALKTNGQPAWNSDLTQHACYSESALQPCVRDMHALHKNADKNSLQAVRKKYSQEKHGAVTSIPPANM